MDLPHHPINMAVPPHHCSNPCFFNQCIEKNRHLRHLRDEATKEVDNDEVKLIVEDQIELLYGNKRLYERINNNLKEHNFESLFAREQLMLFEARTTFFYEFCGRRPTLFDFTTPYHITKNFDCVMAMVCTTSDILNKARLANPSCPEDCKCLVEYFEEDEDEASNASLFDREGMEVIAVDREDLEGFGLGFNDAAQMIMAVHRVGPSTLFESALKAAVLNDISLNEVPKEIQRKASQGLYKVDDSIPENLTPKGKWLYGRLRAQYED